MYFDPIYLEIVGNQNFEFSNFWKIFCPITEYNFIISETTNFSFISSNNYKSIQYFEEKMIEKKVLSI